MTQADGTIRVVARMVAQPDKVEQLRALLATLVEPTRAESGCITYELMQGRLDPAEFTFVEEWADETALEAHFASEHLRRVTPQLGNLTVGAPEITTYTVIS